LGKAFFTLNVKSAQLVQLPEQQLAISDASKHVSFHVSSQTVSQNNHGCPEQLSSLQHAVEQLADSHVPVAAVCMNEPAMVS
jgi:hypothetical protein